MKPCVLTVGADNTRTLVTVHVFVHAAAQSTNYIGFMRTSFFEGDPERKRGKVNATVNPGNRPVGSTVVGLVTSKAGTYTLAISVDAIQQGETNPVHISAEIPVVIK